MSQFTFVPTTLQDVYIIEAKVFADHRGYFMETFREEAFAEQGIHVHFVQDNESKSTRGVLRGLHFQKKHTQGKLVRVSKGEIYDVAVDLRIGSPTYGKAEGFRLSEANKRQLYIPEGFAHGFLVCSQEAVFHYKCTDTYAPGEEGGLLWNDPALQITWPLEEGMEILLSDKDKALPRLEDLKSPFKYEVCLKKDQMTLEPITEKDIEIMRIWRNIESNKNSFVDKSLISREEQTKWYEKYRSNVNERMFMIKWQGRNVGMVGLYHIDMQKKEAEFGRLLVGDLSMRGKQLGYKATELLCAYGLETLGLEIITLEVFKDNVVAKQAYIRAGFEIVGERTENEQVLLQMVLRKRGNA